MGYHGYNMFGGLNLNEQQRKEVSKVLDEQQKRQYELMGKSMELRSKLRNLYAQETWDSSAITGVYDQLAKIQSDMVKSRIAARNRIYNVLTPEQRQQYRTWLDPVPG
jgi:Spy/CpxP family protein refolding chaperone